MLKSAILSLAVMLACVCVADAAQLNKIAAKVNGQIITMYDLQKNAVPDLIRAKVNPNDMNRAKPVLAKVLDAMIMDILIEQEAKRLNITVSRRELDDEITRMMQGRGMTKEQFEKQLAAQKIPLAEFRKNKEMEILRQKVMGVEVGRRVVVTDEEIKSYYEAHKDTMYDRKGLHMGILVYHPQKSSPKAVAAQIASGKISFAEACAKNSIFPKPDRGADVGPVDWEHLNPEFNARLMAMKPGETSPLFEIQKGFFAQVHLFDPSGAKALKTYTFDQAKPIIDGILRQPKAAARFDDYSRQLRQKALIENYL